MEQNDNKLDDFCFNFDAIRGQQSRRPFYTATIPWRVVSRLFDFDTGNVLERSQRETNPARANAIVRYLKRNPDNFVLPPLVGTLDSSSTKFEGLDKGSNLGNLRVSMDAKIKLLDGQHRMTAIIAVLRERPEFGQENIAVQLFMSMSLAERQQAFSDINSNSRPVSRSLNLAYNHRDDTLVKMSEEVDRVRSWAGRIDRERNSANHKFGRLFSYKHVVAASSLLLDLKKGERLDDIAAMKVSSWWNAISAPVGWDEEAIDPEKISNTAVGLNALARFGRMVDECSKEHPDISKFSVAQPMFEIDWSKGADIWQDVLVADNKMITGKKAEIAAATLLASITKLPDYRQVAA